MAITNEEYESIQRIYEERRRENDYRLRKRRDTVEARIPEYSECELKIARLSLECSRALITSGDEDERRKKLDALKADIAELGRRKAQLLSDGGFPEDYLQPTYFCDICKDRGYVNGQKCTCFKQLELKPLYDASRIADILKENNFSLLRYDYYTGEDLKAFEAAVEGCHKFIDNFNSDYQNLLFYGTVGSGKSFLSDCVAAELLEQGHSIIYFSAEQLFKSISSALSDKQRAAADGLYERLFNSELLIIDDLGTEMTNDFTLSQLFHIINERILNRRSYIISTNLDLEQIRQRYSDRLFSRLAESCRIFRLSARDIRLRRKLEKEYST